MVLKKLIYVSGYLCNFNWISLLTVDNFKLLNLELILREVELTICQINYVQFNCLKNDWCKFYLQTYSCINSFNYVV